MLVAALFAIFLWWFSTGAILWAVTRSGNGRPWAVALMAPIAVLAFAAVVSSGSSLDFYAVYGGFTAAVIFWGWFEFAFLTGVLTGPNRQDCPQGARGWNRFRAAWWTVAHHEVALLGATLVIVTALSGAENQIAVWTFLILFAARISAKLNVYLGVPNLSDDLMPAPVRHLRSYFAKRAMNFLFPLSVTALTVVSAIWIMRALEAPAGGPVETAHTLLATLTVLALVEHWLMVLPVRDSVLWQWTSNPRKLASFESSKPAE